MSKHFYIFPLFGILLFNSCQFENTESLEARSEEGLPQETTYINPGTTYSYATVAPKNAQIIYVSGINARGENGETLSLEVQLKRTFEKLSEILDEAGSKPECILMIKQYTTRMDDEFFDIFLRERGKFLKGAKPSSALIPMVKLEENNIDIEIELVCYKSE